MEQLEQIIVGALVAIVAGAALYFKRLVNAKNKAEERATDEAFKRIKLEVGNEIRDKSNSQLVNDANARYSGKPESDN